jgi:hypothetical protein
VKAAAPMSSMYDDSASYAHPAIAQTAVMTTFVVMKSGRFHRAGSVCSRAYSIENGFPSAIVAQAPAAYAPLAKTPICRATHMLSSTVTASVAKTKKPSPSQQQSKERHGLGPSAIDGGNAFFGAGAKAPALNRHPLAAAAEP